MTWSPETCDQLKALVAQGLSGGQIAERMGISRSAVVGKIHRDKLVLARSAGSKIKVGRPVPVAKQKPAKTAAAPLVPIAAPRLVVAAPPMALEQPMAALPGNAATIIVVPMPFSRALAEGRCLFYAADPYSPASADMLVCGCKRANLRRKPYCAAHLAAETERKVAA